MAGTVRCYGAAEGVKASKLFLTQMIARHEGAVMMADNDIEQGQCPAAIAMAESIRTSRQT
ncbi:MAG: DUF305 domain-containing protein [Mycolicibacterium sp.]|uniref:DUF305 domain-containing protein n=1 Tax=Mycolicibacterium sp. TaxID=2320850 RepID=UPI003D0F8F19